MDKADLQILLNWAMWCEWSRVNWRTI